MPTLDRPGHETPCSNAGSDRAEPSSRRQRSFQTSTSVSILVRLKPSSTYRATCASYLGRVRFLSQPAILGRGHAPSPGNATLSTMIIMEPVPIADLTSREAVLSAIAEFDRIGREAFLEKYGFGPSRSYYLRHEGKLYDSKAIVGVAVGYEHADRGPMKSSEFSGGETTVKARLEALGFEAVDEGEAANRRLKLPQRQVDAFAARLPTPEYKKHERNYKLAVSIVLSSLLSPERLKSSDFLELLSDFFDHNLDLDRLDLTADQLEFVQESVAHISGITGAFTNLCSGRFGVNNFIWIPGAIADGLGEQIRTAFADLLAADSQVPERVDHFRSVLVEIQESAKERPRWRENWKVIRPSLSFVAALLAAVDRQRFSFYLQGKIKPSYEDLVGKWPSGSMGRIYEEVVRFVGDVRTALEVQGAPVQDLIDAQSFLYLREDLAPTRAWVFQAHPKLYDIDAALRSLRQLSWGIRQHKTRIHEGDRVYFWRSGRDAGLVAVGTVMTEPEVHAGDPVEDEFILDPDFLSGDELRVRVDVEKVLDVPISRSSILDDEVLADMVVIRAPVGTNFTVTPKQDERLRALIEESATAAPWRFFILQQRAEQGYSQDEEGRVYHFSPQAAGAWKRLANSPGAAFVYYRPGSAGGETAQTYFGAGRIDQVEEGGEGDDRQFLARVSSYEPFARPVPAAEYDPRPNVQMSIAEIDEKTYRELIRRGGARSESLQELAADLCLPVDWLRMIWGLLEERRQVIFKGPPGTGKTYVARELARHIAGDPSRVRLVQFHASYAYEDFVQGYRPVIVDGAAAFKLVDGPLIELAEQAASDPDNIYVLLIDELNRGNVAKVFGELYFLLEYRDEAVRLQYGAGAGQGDFKLPKNLLFIGTMNTADQSIALLDSALRRRFRFVDFYPTEPPIDELLRTWLRRHDYGAEFDWLPDVLDEANRQLGDREIAIGPSYFLDPERRLTEKRVADLWEHAVLPYLEEHFFGEQERRRDFTLDALRSTLEAASEPNQLEPGDEPTID